MLFRSSNSEYTHFSGDVLAGVGSSHGVQLSGGSTGGVVAACGDDANVSLTVRGKGAGGVIFGSTRVQVAAGTIADVGSTSAAGTLGNIGGVQGPAATAQSGWLTIFDSSGGRAFVPLFR